MHANTPSGPAVVDDIGPFAIVPEWVIDADISLGALKLYCVLSRYVNRRLTCWPSRKTLADRMGCSVKSVDRYTNELERIGALDVERRAVDADRNDTNRYRLRRLATQVSLLGDADVPQVGDGDVPQVRVTSVAENESHLERDVSASTEALTRSTRNRRVDELFESVCRSCDIDWTDLTRSERGKLNRAVAQLREIDASPDAVAERAANYVTHFGDAALTPLGLAGQWAKCAKPKSTRGGRGTAADRTDDAIRRFMASGTDQKGIPQ